MTPRPRMRKVRAWLIGEINWLDTDRRMTIPDFVYRYRSQAESMKKKLDLDDPIIRATITYQLPPSGRKKEKRR